jgi:hypothetical protein
VTTQVHLTVAKPWAEVLFAGQLDDDGARLLCEVVESASALGCRRITIRVDAVHGPLLEAKLEEFRGFDAGGEASLHLVPEPIHPQEGRGR